MKRIIILLGLCFYFSISVPIIHAQSLEETNQDLQSMQEMMSEMQHVIQLQGKRINVLEKENVELKQELDNIIRTPVGAPVSTAGPVGLSRYGASSGLNAFNPEIGLLADIVASFSESGEDAEGNDKVSVRELELIIGHDIDPYGRFDATIALSDFEEVVIEEAYLSFWGLPADLKMRLGRIRPFIGKATSAHRDILETVDEPLVVQNYLGIEGLFLTGLEFNWYIPFEWEMLTQDLTFGVLEGGVGEEGTLFGKTRKRPIVFVHLRNFVDLSDVSSLELGGTFLTGSSDADSNFDVNALGLDLTFIHFFNQTNRLKMQSEVYFQNRDDPFVGEDDETDLFGFDDNPWGLYALLDYRLSSRWSLGGRYDYVIPTDIRFADPEEANYALSAYFTLHQSEYARWRLQYQHIETVDGRDDERIFVQGAFAIGVHKHQLQ